MSESRDRVFSVYFLNDGHYKHVNAHIGLMPEQDENGKRNLGYTGSLYPYDDPFARIKITSQTDIDHLRRTENDNPVYAEDVVWDGEFNLTQAEYAIKALRKIKKYLDDAREIAGHYSSIGQYITRVVKACKVKKIVMKWDGEYQVFNVDYAGMLIDRKVKEWQNEANGVTSVS